MMAGNDPLIMEFCIASAYQRLGCEQALPDEDIVVACYSKATLEGWPGLVRGCLKIIADARQSRFLLFILSIYPHLDDDNIEILAKKYKAQPSDLKSEPGHATLRSSPMDTTSSSVSGRDRGVSGESDENGETTPEASDTEMDSSSDSDADIPDSGSGSSADSDFEQEVGGTYFDDSWRCEECSYELINGECPNGHDMQRCESCNWQLIDGTCPMCLENCEVCGLEKIDGACKNCALADDSGEEGFIVYDPKEAVWGCAYCLWEVEADNSVDGNCHCVNAKGEACCLDLSECLDYEPADSCTSEDEASDDEGDSVDENFINDEDVAIDGAFDPTMEIMMLDRITGFKNGAGPFKDAAEEAKAELPQLDRENLQPGPSDESRTIGSPSR